jgi:adenine-specific DNA-methyltransferase
MAKQLTQKTVESIKHGGAKRKNIPTAEYRSVMKDEEQNPIRIAYERRNRDLDPQLVWRGKDEQDWSDLVVQAPPLYIQEKVHPKVLIDDIHMKDVTMYGLVIPAIARRTYVVQKHGIGAGMAYILPSDITALIV